MGMKVKKVEYASSKQILAIPDHYVALGFKHELATAEEPGLAVLQEGRYVVKAGTIFKQGEKVIGIVLNDYDVTESDAMLAVVIHGFIKEEALPVKPSTEQKAALPLIKFVEKATV